MPKSYKPLVIEEIFKQLFDPKTGTLSRTVVTAADIQNAKRIVNRDHDLQIKVDSNPFNFMKDIVRGKKAAAFWPETIRELGYIGEQVTGDGAVFEFVPYVSGTENSLSVDFVPSAATPRFLVQSLSLPQAAKSLGRNDEPWLLQVAVNLRIVETHFAVGENKQIEAAEVSHLQMDIKLRKVQIDALFLVQYFSDSTQRALKSALASIEAKRGDQRILIEQIKRQVLATFASTSTELVIPIAVSAIRDQGIFVVEFKTVSRDKLSDFVEPEFHREALFILEPPVPGI
jgi:hypothetical protein